MRVYDSKDVPKCQWDACKYDAISQVYNEAATENLFLCRIHRGVAVINLEMTGKLRIDQAKNQLATNRPGKKGKDTGPRPTSTSEDWEKVAAQQADAAAVPIDPLVDEIDPHNDQRAIISDIPKPRPIQ